MISKASIFLFLFVFISCSRLSNKKTFNSETVIENSSREYVLEDKAGRFLFKREIGMQKRKKRFIVKGLVFEDETKKDKPLEKFVSISELGSMKGTNIMRPVASQSIVWFDGKKYSTRMDVNFKKRVMKINLKSPEKQWDKIFEQDFPRSNNLFCFYSQIIECISITGFIAKAIKDQKGSLAINLIWDGYPYFMEQYLNIPQQVFADAVFRYDGRNRSGEPRFSLDVAEQSVFYFVNDSFQYDKQFWIPQGLSVVPRKDSE